jgi:hypothetical protein
MTFYEAIATARRRIGGGVAVAAIVRRTGTVDVRWPLSPSRTRPTDLLQRQLSEERN